MRKELNIKQKRVMIYFITAAKELIESEGVLLEMRYSTSLLC